MTRKLYLRKRTERLSRNVILPWLAVRLLGFLIYIREIMVFTLHGGWKTNYLM